jgi:CHAD domain-containing protein
MAVTTHTETERKYETGSGVKLPAWTGIPEVAGVDGPRTERLDAVYYDTMDRRLGRRSATLRRRTGGSDAGWHLKVPAGEDSRTELRLPLDKRKKGATNAPPEELVDLTFAMTRGMEIRPIARLRTERRVWRLLSEGGEPLAEVTDDRVSAERLDDDSAEDRWRELEVELVDPAATALLDEVEKVLGKAGIKRAGHGSKLARVLPPPRGPEFDAKGKAGEAVLAYVGAQADVLVTQDLRVRRDGDDAVHQMRVAARRLRSALRVYGKLLPDTARLQDDLQWLGQGLAPARDLEVQREHLEAAVASLPDELVAGPVAARLTRHFAPAEAASREGVEKTLRSKRYHRLLDELDRLLTDPSYGDRASRKAAKELPKHLRKAYRKVRDRLGGDTLHRARKAAKRYRYGLEVAEPAIGKRARKARKDAKTLTKVLGEHQDGVVAQPLLRELGMQAHVAGENGFTFGLLLGAERARGERVVREYPAYWRKVRASRL